MKRKLKAGVRAAGVGTEILFALWVAESVFAELGETEIVVTSLTDGKHSVGSKHYSGEGMDLRIWSLKEKGNAERAKELIQHRLGKKYDVVLEVDHLHLEYDDS